MIFRIIGSVIMGGIGVGVGYGLGWVGGLAVGSVTGLTTGVCTAADAAATQGFLDAAKAEQIGAAMLQMVEQKDQAESLKSMMQANPPNTSPICQQLRKGIAQAGS